MSIAAAMIAGVFDVCMDASLFRMYVMSNRLDIEFNMAALADDVEPDLDPIIFDTAQMKRIYDWAYETARTGYEWRKAPPGLSPGDILDSAAAAAAAAGRQKR